MAEKGKASRNSTEIRIDWKGSAWQDESTFHQLSPYIGKTKSSMAASLIAQFTAPGDLVLDPFSGCGTFAFEAWAAGRHVIANDLSPYGYVLTRAKLFPYRTLEAALRDFERLRGRVVVQPAVDLRKVPLWVRRFFHPETLREIVGWVEVLSDSERWFLLSCLLGILHHQRPGFLSFPSSHTVPYLRETKFPRTDFPDLYAYRTVADRLERKIRRAFRRIPALDYALTRECSKKSASALLLRRRVDAIVSSPPYMRQLDYARDNRLRLWFLGVGDWDALDDLVSPHEEAFLRLMESCFTKWYSFLKPGGKCVLVMGDNCSREGRSQLPAAVARIATERVGGFTLKTTHTELIPNERRVRRGLAGSTSETVLVLERAEDA